LNRKSVSDLRDMKGRQKLAMLTVYDFPHAQILDTCGLDILFVGDTLGEVELGFDRTSSVTMEMMLHHLGAVHRAVSHTHLLSDMPFGSYATPEAALANAQRLLDAGADSVKLEGSHAEVVRHLTSHGIGVMGHVGLQPQTARRYVRQGTKEASAKRILKEAALMDESGCYALVLEYIPFELADRITREISIPTVGIGAGPACDGQVLVLNDMLGLFDEVPRYVKKYARLSEAIAEAGGAFARDVREGAYPSADEGRR